MVGGNRVTSRARWGLSLAALLAGGALCALVLLFATSHAAALAAPSQSLAHEAGNIQSAQAHPAFAPTATPQPTQIDLSQPTAGASLPTTAPATTTLGSNGLTIAVTLSCLTFILGLVVGCAALMVLLRGGYGPFLRALLPGGRRSSRRSRPITYGPGRSPAPRRPASTTRRR